MVSFDPHPVEHQNSAPTPKVLIHTPVPHLVVGREFAAPAGPQLLETKTQVSTAELQQDLFGLVEQPSAQFPLHLQHALQPQHAVGSVKRL